MKQKKLRNIDDGIELVLYPARLQDTQVLSRELNKIKWYIYEILQDIRRKPNGYLLENSKNIAEEILNQKIALLKQEIAYKKCILKNKATFFNSCKKERIAFKKQINESIRKLKDLKLDLQYLLKR